MVLKECQRDYPAHSDTIEGWKKPIEAQLQKRKANFEQFIRSMRKVNLNADQTFNGEEQTNGSTNEATVPSLSGSSLQKPNLCVSIIQFHSQIQETKECQVFLIIIQGFQLLIKNIEKILECNRRRNMEWQLKDKMD